MTASLRQLTIFLASMLLVLGPAAGQLDLRATITSVERYEATGSIFQDSSAMTLELFSTGDSEGYRALDVKGDMTIEIDSSVDDPSLPIRLASEDNTTVAFSGQGQLRTSATHSTYRFFLHAADARIEFVDDGVFRTRFTSEGSASKSETPAQNREVPDVPLAGSFEIKETSAQLRIEGAFWFSFFEWDMVLDTAEGSSIISTGNTYEGPGGVEGGDLVPRVGGRSEWREAFVTVHNGTMVLPLDETDVQFMYAWLTSGEVNGTVEVEGRQAGQTIQAHRFSGHVFTQLEGGTEGVQMKVLEPTPAPDEGIHESDELSAPVQGHAVGPSSAVPDVSPTNALPAGIYLAVALALMFIVALVAGRYRRTTRRLHAAETAYAAGNHARVLDLTPKILRTKRTQQRATLLHALALLEEEGPDAARLFIDWLPQSRRPGKAMASFLNACIADREGDPERAARCVDACLDSDGAWAEAVASRPSLTKARTRRSLAANPAYA